ncbi:MAG: DUF4157 domain-containing protein, partial [Leptolyngbya sp. SIO4C5]|nr:DUF4157 domain-containing protein [Leptolyngbya sp. SIO4C5]
MSSHSQLSQNASTGDRLSSTSPVSDAFFGQAANQLQPRPFAASPPTKNPATQQPPPDAQAQLEQAKQSGFDASKISLFAGGTAPPQPPSSPQTISAAKSVASPQTQTQQAILQAKIDRARQSGFNPDGVSIFASDTGPSAGQGQTMVAEATANVEAVEQETERSRGQGGSSASVYSADVSSIKIHSGMHVDGSGKSLQAKAFTSGQAVNFKQEAFKSSSRSKQKLLAHELTHRVQQSSNRLHPKTNKAGQTQFKLAQRKTTDTDNAAAAETKQTDVISSAASINPKQTSIAQSESRSNIGEQSQATYPQPAQDNQSIQENQAPVAQESNAQKSEQPAQNTEASPAAQPAVNPTPMAAVETDSSRSEAKAPANIKASAPSTNAGSADNSQAAESSSTESTRTAKSNQVNNTSAAGSVTASAPSVASGAGDAPQSAQVDPDFQAAVSQTKAVAVDEKQHAPAANKAQEAQAAAVAPPGEVTSQAQANQVGEMQQAETPGFNRAAFKAKLMERIASSAPSNLKEADEFKENNQLDAVKGEMSQEVQSEKETSQAPLAEKAQQAPDTSGITPKAVTPLPATETGTPPTSVGAEKAIPKPKGQGEVEAPLQQQSQQLDQQMAEANVTDEQLANSREPEFQAALTAKQDAQTDAATAPKTYRQQEKEQLTQAEGDAASLAQQKLQGMHGDRTQLLAQVANQQIGAKTQDEQARSKVATDIQTIYDTTKGKVETILNGIDGKINPVFDSGAARAQQAFEAHVEKRMTAYKDERYSGWLTGTGNWIKDQFMDLPSEVNVFYVEGRNLYIGQMNSVIDQVVNIIATELSYIVLHLLTTVSNFSFGITQLCRNDVN